MTEDRNISSETEADLHAYVDGHLSADGRRRIEAALAEDPTLAARAASWQAQTRALRAAHMPDREDLVPAHLSAMLHPQRKPSQYRSLQFAAGLVLLLGGAAAGWLANEQFTRDAQTTDSTYDMISGALAAHRVYTAEKRHAVEVNASEEAHLIAWLSRRLGTQLVAPDLAETGFTLVGGRLLPTGNASAAQLMYENDVGERITLYLLATAEDTKTAFRMAAQGDINAFYWTDRGLGCAVTGPVERDVLMRVARIAFKQLEKAIPPS